MRPWISWLGLTPCSVPRCCPKSTRTDWHQEVARSASTTFIQEAWWSLVIVDYWNLFDHCGLLFSVYRALEYPPLVFVAGSMRLERLRDLYVPWCSSITRHCYWFYGEQVCNSLPGGCGVSIQAAAVVDDMLLSPLPIQLQLLSCRWDVLHHLHSRRIKW